MGVSGPPPQINPNPDCQPPHPHVQNKPTPAATVGENPPPAALSPQPTTRPSRFKKKKKHAPAAFWTFVPVHPGIFMNCMESPFQLSAAAQRDSVKRRLQGKKDYRVDMLTTKAKPCRVFWSEQNYSDSIPRVVALLPLPPRDKKKRETKRMFADVFGLQRWHFLKLYWRRKCLRV